VDALHRREQPRVSQLTDHIITLPGERLFSQLIITLGGCFLDVLDELTDGAAKQA
jgi:hypothetical protein